jgi:hypothetical protein
MNNPPEWATHLMTDKLHHGTQFWWNRERYQGTMGSAVISNHVTKEFWEQHGFIFEEINIQLEND